MRNRIRNQGQDRVHGMGIVVGIAMAAVTAAHGVFACVSALAGAGAVAFAMPRCDHGRSGGEPDGTVTTTTTTMTTTQRE